MRLGCSFETSGLSLLHPFPAWLHERTSSWPGLSLHELWLHCLDFCTCFKASSQKLRPSLLLENCFLKGCDVNIAIQ